MADLHAAVLAELDRLDPHRLTTLGKVTAAIIALHAPVREGGTLGYFTCRGCDNGSYAIDSPDWPCSTIQAIARELEVDGER